MVWLEYNWHHSSRQPRFNYYLCLIALEIFQLVQNDFFHLGLIAVGLLHLCSPLTWWIKVLHFQPLLKLVVVSNGTGSL